jgi:superfamily I DNA/RNA helicase
MTLDPFQKEAAACDAPATLVIAGPGSGKTAVLAERYLNLLEDGADTSGILALTFTTKAAVELRQRIAHRRGLSPSALSNITTFHGFSLGFLKKSREFALFDRIRQIELLRSSGVKNPAVAVEEISAHKNTGSPVDGVLMEKYSCAMKEAGALDMDDLIVEAEKLAATERMGLSHALIDEFQDINPPQAALTRRLFLSGAKIFAIGDADQTIYSFRGANIDGFLKFSAAYEGARLIRLGLNYRSTKTIVDAAEAFIRKNTFRVDRTQRPVRGGCEPITIVRCRSEKEEASFIAREIEILMGGLMSRTVRGTSKFGFSDFAVLLRTKRQTLAVEEAFRSSSIPWRALSVPAEVAVLSQHLMGAEIPSGVKIAEFVREKALTAGIEKDLSIVFARMAEAFATLPDFLGHLSFIQPFDTYTEADKVTVTTLHSAKGLEFPVVFIAGCDVMPLRGSELEEERRLFYVGMTRAKDKLYLVSAEKRRGFETKTSPFIDEIPRQYLKEIAIERKSPRTRGFQRGLFE